MTADLNRRQALVAAIAAAAAPSAFAASPASGTAAAKASLDRLFGKRLAGAALTLKSGAGQPWYSVTGKGGQVAIAGDSPVALVRGAYAYLRQAGLAHVSWEGDRVAQGGVLPAVATGKVETPFRHRAYLNTCTYGYTTPWWGGSAGRARSTGWRRTASTCRWPWKARNMSGGPCGASSA